MKIHEFEGQRLAEEPGISSCLAHRCTEHRAVPPLNTTEFSGAECGACVGDRLLRIEEAADQLLWILGSCDLRDCDKMNFDAALIETAAHKLAEARKR